MGHDLGPRVRSWWREGGITCHACSPYVCPLRERPLKQVASLLSEARDVGGRRAFVDVDVLHARVPIVCLQHVHSGIEVDISADRGGAAGHGGEV